MSETLKNKKDIFVMTDQAVPELCLLLYMIGTVE